MFKKTFPALGLAALLPGLAVMSVTGADRLSERANDELPSHITDRMLATPINRQVDVASIMGPRQQAVQGRQNVIVRLKDKPVAKHSDQSPSGRISHKAKLKYDQSNFLQRAEQLAPGCKLLTSTQVVLNSVFMEVDAADIDRLATDSDVYSIHRVADYQMDLSETVPYIGAAAVHSEYDGAGVSVAVLDSGIDYYHADLGGAGDPLEYAADDPTVIEEDTFPTAKVVGGWDFVGSNWQSGLSEEPDPDPLDDGPASGHGTHVGHIIGGVGGVAPGAELYAVKVCSSVSTSCSGIALIQGMEFAADPNGDGDPSDAVDVINMSLGSSYGQAFDDDLAVAVDNATALGILTVASAGNSSDKPYANGTPAGALTALSVAQTQVPSAGLQLISVEEDNYPGVFQPWSTPPAGVITGDTQYGDGAGGNLNGCAPFAPGSLTGLIVLVDRGACNFTAKVFNVEGGGGVVGIIGLVGPGAPFSGGDGGDGPITIPGYMISQADANAFKSQVVSVATVDPDNGLPLIGQMVGSSARGPQHEAGNLIKPEIGAPGASVSAIAGTGTGTGPFGGTSGAAPMVAGAAALLLQAEPGLSPAEAKARLINTGDTDIDTDPFTGPAPITRIGGGEVRVDRAIAATAAAWDKDTGQGALSFGFVDVDKKKEKLKKDLEIKNYSDDKVEYDVSFSFRYPEDEDSGAVEIKLSPDSVKVKSGETKKVKVELTINGELLSGNTMNSGSMGADPDALTAQEFDGYITFDDDSKPIHVPWHVLPRQSADMKDKKLKFKNGSDTVKLDNKGVGVAQNDAYALIATSDNQPEGGLGEQSPTPDIRAVGVNTFQVPPGFCEAEFLWAFAINTWERQQHLLPVTHQVFLDTNQDGTDDYLLLNRDLSGFGTISDGRQVTYAVDLGTGFASIFFFAEHATNTGNTVLLACGEQVGLSAADILATNVDVTVVAQDFYFGGPGDLIDGLTITPLGEQYFGIPEDVPGKTKGEMEVLDFGPFPGNSPEEGVLLFTNGDRGAGARGGATEKSEALLYLVK